jgi:hypothetical protein
MGEGKVEITVEEFLKLLKLEKQEPAVPPRQYFFSKAVYSGVTRENCILLKCSFEACLRKEGEWEGEGKGGKKGNRRGRGE